MGRLSPTDEECRAPIPKQWPNIVLWPSPPQLSQAVHHHRFVAPIPAWEADCKTTPLTHSHMTESDTLPDKRPQDPLKGAPREYTVAAP